MGLGTTREHKAISHRGALTRRRGQYVMSVERNIGRTAAVIQRNFSFSH
jgi:hypothetical protein